MLGSTNWFSEITTSRFDNRIINLFLDTEIWNNLSDYLCKSATDYMEIRNKNPDIKKMHGQIANFFGQISSESVLELIQGMETFLYDMTQV